MFEMHSFLFMQVINEEDWHQSHVCTVNMKQVGNLFYIHILDDCFKVKGLVLHYCATEYVKWLLREKVSHLLHLWFCWISLSTCSPHWPPPGGDVSQHQNADDCLRTLCKLRFLQSAVHSHSVTPSWTVTSFQSSVGICVCQSETVETLKLVSKNIKGWVFPLPETPITPSSPNCHCVHNQSECFPTDCAHLYCIEFDFKTPYFQWCLHFSTFITCLQKKMKVLQ